MCQHISRVEHDFSQILSNEKSIQCSLTPTTFNWTHIQHNGQEIQTLYRMGGHKVLVILALTFVYVEEWLSQCHETVRGRTFLCRRKKT